MADRYLLSLNIFGVKPKWQEVTKEQWVRAERIAGFRNTMGQPDEPATRGFTGGGIRGTIKQRREKTSEEDPLKRTEMAKDPWDRTHRSTVPDGYNDYY